MSAIKEAMETAGIRSSKDRLREIAIQALIRHGDSWDDARRAVFLAARGDLALVWELMEPYREMALTRLLVDVTRDMREAAGARGAIQTHADDHHRADRFQRGGGGKPVPDDQGKRASPIPPDDARLAGYRDAASTISGKLTASMLDTFMIDGTPIGNWQAGAARAWAHQTGRHVRFVELLTENVPAFDPIRKWIDPDMAHALWDRTAT